MSDKKTPYPIPHEVPKKREDRHGDRQRDDGGDKIIKKDRGGYVEPSKPWPKK